MVIDHRLCSASSAHTNAQVVKRFAKRVMPHPLVRLVRRIQHYRAGCGWRVPPRLQPLPAHASRELALMHRAWEIAARSEGNQLHICYYSMEFQGFQLPGERSWPRRWALIGSSVPWRGARVLELGCNIALLSAFALRAGASHALLVDYDETLLDASRLVQQALAVGAPSMTCDFNDSRPWEEALAAFRPTIVTALSLLNWVNDKERFLRFLRRFDMVLYEGHDCADVERRRLERAGLHDIRLLGRSEYDRAMFLARGGANL
jgi:hypothetical protein